MVWRERGFDRTRCTHNTATYTHCLHFKKVPEAKANSTAKELEPLGSSNLTRLNSGILSVLSEDDIETLHPFRNFVLPWLPFPQIILLMAFHDYTKKLDNVVIAHSWQTTS